MKITNIKGVPSQLVVAAYQDRYSRGDANISVTELIDSPRIRIMHDAYEPEQDISNMVWPLLGTSFHSLMEMGGDEHDSITEQRFFAEIEGWVVSGQIDRVDHVSTDPVITDYKVTSVYTVGRGRDEWHHQLNIYGWLYYKKRGVFPKLNILALCRDWRPAEALYGKHKGYPDTPIVRIEIPMMPQEKLERYIRERIYLHKNARRIYEEEGRIVECSPEERWAEPDKYAVVKKGNQRATATFDTKGKARRFVDQRALAKRIVATPEDYIIVPRYGKNRRCDGYCVFKDVCTQHKDIKDLQQAGELIDTILQEA